MSDEAKLRVTHVISGLTGGGAEGVLVRLCAASPSIEHRVVALTGEGVNSAPLRRLGVPLLHLNMHTMQGKLSGLPRLIRYLRRLHPDVIQTWLYHGDFVGGFASILAGRIPLLWNVRHSTTDADSRHIYALARINARLSHWLPRMMISPAQRAAAHHVNLGYQASKFVIIPNGFDVQHYRPDAEARNRLRQQWGVGDRDFVIGLVARAHPQKDHPTLLRALARLHHRKLRPLCVLVGAGVTPGDASWFPLVAELGLNTQVRLLGPRTDIPAVMNALDAHVLSSRSGEAFPNVVAEAMACATPSLVSDVGDAAEMVGDRGLVVPPGDPDALAAGIERLQRAFADPQAYARLGAAARNRVVEQYSLARMAAAYERLWRAACRR